MQWEGSFQHKSSVVWDSAQTLSLQQDCEELEFGPCAIGMVAVSFQLTRDVSDFKYNLSVTREFMITRIKCSTHNLHAHLSGRKWDSEEIGSIKNTPDPDKTHCFFVGISSSLYVRSFFLLSEWSLNRQVWKYLQDDTENFCLELTNHFTACLF